MNPHPPRAMATMRASRFRRSGSAAGGVLGGGGVLRPDEGGLLLGLVTPSEVRRGMTCSSSDPSGEPGLMQLRVKAGDHVPVGPPGQIAGAD
jgi:hypothetical protein